MKKAEQVRLIELAIDKGVKALGLEYGGRFAVNVENFVTYDVDRARLVIAAVAGGHLSVEVIRG